MIWFLKFECAKVEVFLKKGVEKRENFQQGGSDGIQ